MKQNISLSFWDIEHFFKACAPPPTPNLVSLSLSSPQLWMLCWYVCFTHTYLFWQIHIQLYQFPFWLLIVITHFSKTLPSVSQDGFKQQGARCLIHVVYSHGSITNVPEEKMFHEGIQYSLSLSKVFWGHVKSSYHWVCKIWRLKSTLVSQLCRINTLKYKLLLNFPKA